MSDRGVVVVVPVHRNEATLRELVERLEIALGSQLAEVVLVDDASPDGSRAVADALAAERSAVRVLPLEVNVGQHAAIIAGLASTTAPLAAVLDADLQDRPEDLHALVAAVPDGGVAAAGRRGSYESRGRMLTGALARTSLWAASRRRIPRDAGLFFVGDGTAVRSALTGARPGDHVLALLARAGVEICTVPIVRRPRAEGTSSYRGIDRLRVARAGLRTSVRRTPARARCADVAHHNDVQTAYFSRSALPRMTPGDTPYVRRQIDEVARAARLEPGRSVLEVGAGMGRYSFGLARLGVRLECLDLTPAVLARLATADRDHVILARHCADVAHLPDSLVGRFDAVVGFFALHHMHDLHACLAGAARALRPGGRLVFCEPNAFNPLFYAQIALTPGMTWEGDRGVARMRPSIVVPAMVDAGLTDVALRRFGAFPPVLTNRPVGRRAEAALERIPGWGAVKPFQLFLGHRP
jgi:glycosyltransferase involved in cell wall biosynthesis